MKVYIEYVLLDNITIDYIIVSLIELTLGRKFRLFNKFLVCLFGGFFALFLPMIIHLKAVSFVFKIITSIILVLLLKRYKKVKEFVFYYLLFFAYTFFIGGLILGVIQLLGIDYTMSSVVMYEFEFPFGLFALIAVIVFKMMFKLIRVAKVKLVGSNFIRKVTLINDNKKIDIYGFCDSGNNVKYNGKGVSIITLNVFFKLYNDVTLSDLVLNKIKKNSNDTWEYINISGVGKSYKYLSFEIESMFIDGVEISRPRLALTYKNFEDYDIVLNNEFIGGKI